MQNRMMFFCNGGAKIAPEDFGRAMCRLENRIEIEPPGEDETLRIKSAGLHCGILLRIQEQDPECGRIVQGLAQRVGPAAGADGQFFLERLSETKSIIFSQISDDLSNSEPAQVAFFKAAQYLMKKGLGIMFDEMTGLMAHERFLSIAAMQPDEPPAKPTTETIGQSPAGSPIYKHSEPKPFLEAYTAPPAESNRKKIEKHIETWIGKIDTVFHELVSSHVHIDVNIVAPTKERPFYTLVTSGMSDRPMNTPPGAEEFRLAELMICLPPGWELPDAFNPQKQLPAESYWPIEGLKTLARMPHEYNTWLFRSHTVGGEGAGIQIAPGLKFNTWLVEIPLLVPNEFRTLAIGENDCIYFWSILPIYQEEADLKLKKGIEALEDKFSKGRVSELLDPKRPNVCRKRFGII